LKESLTANSVHIDPTTIATDVELPAAGKHAGAKVIYEWINSGDENLDLSFISFGDSSSDYEMARYFAQQDTKSTFVYVGKSPDAIEQDERVSFVTTKARYSSGALEFLRFLDS
jgi:hypothetical protein